MTSEQHHFTKKRIAKIFFGLYSVGDLFAVKYR